MNALTGPLYGERATPTMLAACYDAFPGITTHADRIASAFPGLIAAEVDAGDMFERQHRAQSRWPGVRNPLSERHPIAAQLRAAIDLRPDVMPESDPEIVAALKSLGCIRVGRIVSYRGVPVPAGDDQIAYYTVMRFRPLYSPLADPALVYRGDKAYDAAHVTDEMQESVLLVSTRVHRDNLAVLQRTTPALFLAIWMRDPDAAEKIAACTDTSKLPPCYPRSRLSDRRKCLSIVCDVMNEHERAFELSHELRFIGGVTRTSVRAALESCTCMTHVYSVSAKTHRHIAASAAHTRSVHPTMNTEVSKAGEDVEFVAAAAAFESSAVYRERYRHVIWIAGEMPVRFFLGIEPTMLIPVALIQIREFVVQHEGRFWLGQRGKQGFYEGLLSTRLMSLAAIITSNLCVPTARAMMHDDGMLLPTAWLRENISPRIRNQKLGTPLVKAPKLKDDDGLHNSTTMKAPRLHKVVGDSDDFKSSYAGALRRAKLCSAELGEPGWTRGFRPSAWRQPFAEVDFLRKCCRYTRFDPAYAPMRDHWDRIAAASGPVTGGQKTSADVHTGLPRQHMVERVQDLFRNWFDPLQVAEGVKGFGSSDAWLRREVFIREIAPLLPALTATTDDPYLNERFWINRKSARVRIAVQGAWQS